MVMSRYRVVKSQFFSSEDVIALSIPARLTFIGLWAYADDYGNGNANPKLIKAAVWPMDEEITVAEVDKHLNALHAGGQISFYEVDDRMYFAVTGWKTHQKVDRPSLTTVPMPPKETSRDTRESLAHASASDSRGDRESLEQSLASVSRGTRGRGERKGEGEGEPSEWEPRESGEREWGESPSRADDVPGLPPSPFCSRHQPHGAPGPCRNCGTARLANQAWKDQQLADMFAGESPDEFGEDD
ncbi:hypothetical protein [Lacisediminihabitans changchengi]|uniref:Uncharacterized protein n=1 Tax=Lacisediminihabitans changchengi TaxID=2787634 RepID=A0A934SQK9_9MICO|nr:hypothetical protein [Lacisediminihabitans changchengi]MBK4347243.1 hypothetical protein [Lacisediminihabitans changchengi]